MQTTSKAYKTELFAKIEDAKRYVREHKSFEINSTLKDVYAALLKAEKHAKSLF